MRDVERALEVIRAYGGPPLRIMEVCGSHTVTACRAGLRSLLPPDIRLVSGPGCPVCLAAGAYIDRLCALALDEGCVVAAFGDLLRVRGSRGTLSEAKAQGARVAMVYSPLEALDLAREHPDKTVVMAAVGFETTAPSYALLLESALEQGVGNIQLLTALKRLTPALEALCTGGNAIGAFIAPGHVAAIIGSDAFLPLSERFGKPFAVSGFTAREMLLGICRLVLEVQRGGHAVANLYEKVVRPQGNGKAQRILERYFTPGPAYWRGLSVLEDSGYSLKEEYARFDAGSAGLCDQEADARGCRCGEVLTGRIDPPQCALFGRACTPENAIGPCMVTAEGACGIWYASGEGEI